MPQLGVWELVIILAIVVIIFGVGRLPEIGGALGKSIRQFRSETSNPEKEAAEEEAKAELAKTEAKSVAAAKDDKV
jgi:sec-independent protein translocase protein TatA